MLSNVRFSLSKLTIYLLLAAMLSIAGYYQKYRKGVIEWDIISYYAYLPGLIIYNDLTFSFIDKNTPEGVVIWTERTPENKHVLKMTSGLSVLYAPFFLMAHGIAKLQPHMYTPNGYSMVYSLFLILSDIFYTIIGFIYLRKILLLYFSEVVCALTLLAIYFGTNMYFYSLFEVMSHCYLFCLVTMFTFYTIQWHAKPSYRYSIYLGLLLGLIILIRPVDILTGGLWLFYGIYSVNSFKEKFSLLWQHKLLILIIGILVCSVFSIQMFYWKYATDSWLYWSYSEEGFFWTQPHILKGLFGFRKGLYIYAPVLLLASVGMFLTYKYVKDFFVPILILFTLFTYVIFSWWCWWYGGGLSIRPMIDIYCIFAIGLGAFIQAILTFKSAIVKYSILAIFAYTVYYGYYVNWQYREGLIHHDSMNYTSWKINFMKDYPHPGYYESLTPPDYESAVRYGHE
ncbi:MAG: hypothetical protein ACTHJT_00235 [Cytophaga sp.]|uniref:hypothetical protein n=1 Tax=Cytophaga sp. TaxID=29535 RepID=UPI003F7EC2CA